MKKIGIFSIVMALAFGAVIFLACNDAFVPQRNSEGKSEITIYLGKERFSLVTGEDFLFGALEELRDKYGIALEYEEMPPFGRMLVAVGSEDSRGVDGFIAIYTSIAHPTISFPQERTVSGTRVFSANLGADELPLSNGEKYFLILTAF